VYRRQHHGLKLYVGGGFSWTSASNCCPLIWRFVRGIVDSNDLPLNVSLRAAAGDSAMLKGCD